MATGFDIYQKSAKNAGLTAPSTGRSISSLLPKQEATPAIAQTVEKEPEYKWGLSSWIADLTKSAGSYLVNYNKDMYAKILANEEQNKQAQKYLDTLAPKEKALAKLKTPTEEPKWTPFAGYKMSTEQAKGVGYETDIRESQYIQKQIAEEIALGKKLGYDPNKPFSAVAIGKSLGESAVPMALAYLGRGKPVDTMIPGMAMVAGAGATYSKIAPIVASTAIGYEYNLMQYAKQGIDIRDKKYQDLALTTAAIDASVEALSADMASGNILENFTKTKVGSRFKFINKFSSWLSNESVRNAEQAAVGLARRKTIGELAKDGATYLLKDAVKIASGATGEGLEEVWGNVASAWATKRILDSESPLFTLRDDEGGLFSVDSMFQSFALGAIAGGIFEGTARVAPNAFKATNAVWKNYSKLTPEQASNPEVIKAVTDQLNEAIAKDKTDKATQEYVVRSNTNLSKIAEAIHNGGKTIKQVVAEVNLPKVVPQVKREVSTRLKTVAKPKVQTPATAQVKAEPVVAEPIKQEAVQAQQPEEKLETFVAYVRDKNGKTIRLEQEYESKKEFISEIKANGYTVDPKQVYSQLDLKVQEDFQDIRNVGALKEQIRIWKKDSGMYSKEIKQATDWLVKNGVIKSPAKAEAPAVKAEEKPVEAKPEKKPAETKTQEQKQEAIKKAIEKTAKLQKVLKPRRSVVATDEQSNLFNKLFEQAMEFVNRKAKKEDVKSSDIIKIDVNDSNMNAFMNLLFDKQNAIDNAIEDGLYTAKQILEEKFAVDVIQKYILQKMTFKKANIVSDFLEDFDMPEDMIRQFEEESEFEEDTDTIRKDIVDISTVTYTPISKQNVNKYADAMIAFRNTGSSEQLKRTITSKNWTEFASLANSYYHMLIANVMETGWVADLIEAIDTIKPTMSKLRKSFDVRIKHLFDQYSENYLEDNMFIESMAKGDGLGTEIKDSNYMGYVFPTEFNEREITLALLGEQMGFRVVFYETFDKAVNAGFFFPDDRMVVYVLRDGNKMSQGDIILNTLIHEIGHGIENMGTVTSKDLKNAIWKSLKIKDETSEKEAFISLRMIASNEDAKTAESAYMEYKKAGKVANEIFAMRYAEVMTNPKALYEFTKNFEEKQISVLDRMLYSLRKAISVMAGKRELRLAIKATQEARDLSIKINGEAVKYSNATLVRSAFTKGIGKIVSAKYQPVGGVVDESIKANSIMKQPTMASKLKSIKDSWNKNFWRSSVNIEYKQADLRNAVTLLRKSLSTASKLAYENMRSIYLGLTQDQMKFLQDAILYSDAYNDVQRGTFDVKNPPVEGWTPDLVTTHWKENIEPLLYPKDSALDTEENRKVRERFEKRKRLIKDYVNEVIDMGRKAGLDLSWINKREYYMQHIMIEFINQQSATAGKKKGKKLTSPFSGRKGESGLSYLTDPISVDYATIRHLSQTIAKLNMLETIYKYDITQERGFAKKYGLVKRSDGMYDENRLAELGLKQMLRQDLNISFDNIQKLTAEASKSLSDLKELASPFYKIVSWATDAKKLEKAKNKVESTKDEDLKKFYQNVIKASADAEFMTEIKLKSKIDIESISRIQNQLYSLNRKNVIIVPAEVADLIMNEIAPKKQANIMEELARLQMSIFKPLMLTSAHKVFEYTARNTYNDVSVVTAFLPEVFAPYKKTVTTKDGTTKTVMTNDVVEAFIELVKMYKHGEMSDRMRKYVMRGGIGGNMASIEIKDFAKDPNFQALYDTIKKTGALDKTGRAVIEAMKAMIGQNAKIESFVELREQILRYAAFIRFSKMIDEDLKAGGTGQPKFYYGSKRVEIQNLSNPVDRALKLSEDLMGAYGDVTPFTQGIAKGMYPFLRWKEVDIKRMFRIAQNTLYKNPNTIASIGKTVANRFAKGAQVGTYAAMRIGWVFVRLAILQGAMAAWNSMIPDDDDLPKEIRESLHLTLPSWMFADDRIHYIGGLNLVSEAANIFDWNSWTNFKDDIQTSLKYGLTPQEIVQRIIKDSATDQWNNLINGSNPFFKTAIEMTMGQSLYPDPSEPRKIRDPIEHLMTIAGLSNEYKAIVGKPIQGGSYLATLGDSVSNSVTKGDAALWTIRALRAEYEDAKGIGNSYGDTTDEKKSKRQDVAYNYKLSLRLGDKNAAKKWLMEYWSLGGTGATMKQSIDSLDPLFKMDNKVKRDFLAQLSEEDKATYEVAKQYVKDLQKLSRSEDYYVPKSAGTK